MTKEITADLLVEDVKVREQYMNRVDVLDKVKKLLLLPELDMATTKQVADFYEVDVKTADNVIMRNKAELQSDGMKILTRKQIALYPQNEGIENTQSVTTITDGQGVQHKFSNRGSMVFPRRAILRVGILLRDSEVTKEVRTQLLNIEEKATAEVKVADITEEDMLLLAMFKAETPEGKIAATKEYDAFKNRYVEKVEAKLAEAETEKECHSLKMFSNFSYERVNILGGENCGRN